MCKTINSFIKVHFSVLKLWTALYTEKHRVEKFLTPAYNQNRMRGTIWTISCEARLINWSQGKKRINKLTKILDIWHATLIDHLESVQGVLIIEHISDYFLSPWVVKRENFKAILWSIDIEICSFRIEGRFVQIFPICDLSRCVINWTRFPQDIYRTHSGWDEFLERGHSGQALFRRGSVIAQWSLSHQGRIFYPIIFTRSHFCLIMPFSQFCVAIWSDAHIHAQWTDRLCKAVNHFSQLLLLDIPGHLVLTARLSRPIMV